MPQEDLIKEIKEALEDLKKLPVIKPEGYSSGTVASYYKEKYALEVKELLDSLLTTSNTLIRCDGQGLKIVSLEAKILQGWKYLIDNLDTPDKKYLDLRQKLEVRRYPSKSQATGILLAWSGYVKDKNKFQTEQIAFDAVDWKSKLESFIDNATEGDQFEEDNCILDEEEWRMLIERIDLSEDLILVPNKINRNKLVIIKNSKLKNS